MNTVVQYFKFTEGITGITDYVATVGKCYRRVTCGVQDWKL